VNAALLAGTALSSLMLLPLISSNVTASHEESARLQVSFAGIHFTFVGPAPLLARVESTPRVMVLTDAAVGVEAESGVNVWCRLDAGIVADGGPRSGLGGRGVEWHWRGNCGEARTQHASARWERRAQRITAEATLAPHRRAAEGLLMVLAGALLHRAGGALLHSASVELPDGIIAFVGPSGAGKSTACEQVEGARQFSFDRLAVAPVERDAGGRSWRAYPLPGGTPPSSDSPEPGSGGRPLIAILRVRQAAEGCWVEPCSTSQGVALLRESAFHANQGPATELELLELLEQLSLDVPIANLHFCLGTSLGPALSRWLTEQTSKRERARTTSRER
jgi:hypothetical protein